MDYWKNKIVIHRFMFVSLAIYFSINLPNLTLLPIFNDESIYLDWAWGTRIPGHLYDSLLDAKQPLMIWIFGIFENFFHDPLFAGRFASVLIGSVTAIGIYSVANKLLNKHAAIFASLLYSVIPIFVFYNRQALMEGAVACIGIWSFNALLNLLCRPSIGKGIILGVIQGIGFFIKSSSLLFVVSSTFIILFCLIKKRRVELIKPYLISIAAIFVIDFLIFINALFWQTLSSNNRYSYTLGELFAFPFNSWIDHFLGFFEMGFLFVTPLVFIAGIIGMFFMGKDKIRNYKTFLAYFIFALLLEIFLVRFQHQRYIVAFLPFIVISASYVLSILWGGNVWRKSLAVASFLLPVLFSVVLIFNPEYYIVQLHKISKYSDYGYISGQTSGYGINEVMRYIEENSSGSQASIVMFGANVGNPESAVDLYSQKAPNLVPLYIDSKFYPGINEYECVTSKYPLFFVTRDDQQAGMEKYFTMEKLFLNPDKIYSVRIYTLKKNCSGKTLSLSDMYEGVVNKALEMKSGGYK